MNAGESEALADLPGVKLHINSESDRDRALDIIEGSAARPDVVLIDSEHGSDCEDIAAAMNRRFPIARLPFIVLTSGETSESDEMWLGRGASDVIGIGTSPALILKRIENAVEAARGAVLREKYHRERLMRDSIINDSIAFFEADITADSMITADSETLAWAEERSIKTYGALISALAQRNTTGEYSQMFLSRLRADKLISCYDGGKNTVSFEYSRRQTGGRGAWFSVTVHLICDSDNGHILALCHTKDISDQKQSELALRDMAERDPLTELYNRSAFELIVERTLSENRIVGDTAAFYMLDIDNFKMINDSFGHDFGDDVLIKVGKILKSVFRSCDYVGRLGGDEYAVLIPKVVARSVILRRADDICRALSIDITKGGGVRRISCSVGVAFAPEHGCDFRTLYKSADTALYDAKSLGKNCYSVYEE